MLESGTTTLLISSDQMNDNMKIIKSLEEFWFLIKGNSETIKNEAKKQKGGFLSMLLGTLSATLLGNLLASKGFGWFPNVFKFCLTLLVAEKMKNSIFKYQ